jgi:hypothetical protein
MKSIHSSDRLETLTNIGKTTSAKLKKIGILTREDFLKRDPYQVFDELLEKVDPTLCRCALASIVGAKLGKPWYEITRQTAVRYQRRRPGHRWGKC